jgi:hypothetical protein
MQETVAKPPRPCNRPWQQWLSPGKSCQLIPAVRREDCQRERPQPLCNIAQIARRNRYKETTQKRHLCDILILF